MGRRACWRPSDPPLFDPQIAEFGIVQLGLEAALVLRVLRENVDALLAPEHDEDVRDVRHPARDAALAARDALGELSHAADRRALHGLTMLDPPGAVRLLVQPG